MEDESDYDIAIARVGGHAQVSDERLMAAIRATLRRHQAFRGRISVALVDDAHITRLNEIHLKHQGPTDVLAYDLRDRAGEELLFSSDGEIDGEIVVSVDSAAREAEARGHDVDLELALYVVHGTLHLLGYDDRTQEEATRMHDLEDEILVSLGLGPVFRRTTR